MTIRTKRRQVALYLEDERIEQLHELGRRLGKTQQDVLRDAIEAKLRQHRLIGVRKSWRAAQIQPS
jgi:predicted DNA-binding protein